MIKIKNSFPQLSEKHLLAAQGGLKALLDRKELGFPRLLERKNLWESSHQRAAELHSQGVRQIGLLGMGGSSLGPRVFWEGLGRWRDKLDDFHFFDNLDSTYFFQRLERLNEPTKIHFVVVSKSGSTLETLAMADYLDQFLKTKGSGLAQQATVISELRSNALSDWARASQVQ